MSTATYAVGDLVRVREDDARSAPVKRGDYGVITEINPLTDPEAGDETLVISVRVKGEVWKFLDGDVEPLNADESFEALTAPTKEAFKDLTAALEALYEPATTGEAAVPQETPSRPSETPASGTRTGTAAMSAREAAHRAQGCSISEPHVHHADGAVERLNFFEVTDGDGDKAIFVDYRGLSPVDLSLGVITNVGALRVNLTESNALELADWILETYGDQDDEEGCDDDCTCNDDE